MVCRKYHDNAFNQETAPEAVVVADASTELNKAFTDEPASALALLV